MYFPTFEELGLPELLSVVAGIAFLLVVVNYIINFLPASLLKGDHIEKAGALLPVTVIVCARNEDQNLLEFLPSVLKQDYPEFEVVVVNDCSTDNTGHVVDELARTYPRLRKADIKEDAYYKHGKKFAVLVGIKSAKYNHLLFTDADCYPASDQWLKQMAGGFTEKRNIVLGYGAYKKEEGLLNSLIRYDAFSAAVQYFSAAIRKSPYMGVGRNLAYTRELFFSNKGFANHYHLKSGDDDLFVNETANSENTNVCINANAITISRPKKTFKEWSLQKARHLTTAPYYNSSSKARLGFNHFVNYFFLLSLIALAFSLQTVLIIPILLLLKAAVQVLMFQKAAARLGERDLLAGAPFYELILLFIYPIFQATKVFYKPNRWTN